MQDVQVDWNVGFWVCQSTLYALPFGCVERLVVLRTLSADIQAVNSPKLLCPNPCYRCDVVAVDVWTIVAAGYVYSSLVVAMVVIVVVLWPDA